VIGHNADALGGMAAVVTGVPGITVAVTENIS